ncbi:MAG: hypothetical protein C0170_06005 [Hydrogenobaculum sp.]|nr:MAG: hypothetical protein C0170_06005 [Hydrogenobaculum sp.]
MLKIINVLLILAFIIRFSFAQPTINVGSSFFMHNGAYAITLYKKPINVFNKGFSYVGVSSFKGEKYVLYINNAKGYFGGGIYEAWISFVPLKVYKSIKDQIHKTNEDYYKQTHQKPKESAEEVTNSLAPNYGMFYTIKAYCYNKKLSLINPIGMNFIYKIDEKSPIINKKLFDLMCSSKIPVVENRVMY